MAGQGLGYQSIIRHYYPGTGLALLDEYGERESVLDTTVSWRQ
jgi:peptidoglycan hydrolase-like amidase